MKKITLTEYLKSPCRVTSIPYWKQQNTELPDDMKIIHNKDFVQSEFSGYIDEPYFRLYHDLELVKKVNTHNVEIVGCASASLDKFVEIINASYSDLSVTKQQLENYFKTPVYCPELWILLKDKSTGNIVGCGIADYDKSIGELILEWIQVLPRYRQKGYGSIMVNYFLKKMQGKAKFATVSGKINSATKPENLYRKCGFTGDDIWHILHKK